MSEAALQKEFEKHTEGTLKDEDVEKARSLIGVRIPGPDKEQIFTASVDNIRTFAYGCGNDNPLHCDPDYASATRWGEVVAPTIMAVCINKPMLGDGLTPEQKARTKGMFKGVHNFISGGEWEFYRPIYAGDTMYSYKEVESAELQASEFAGRKFNRITRQVKINQRAEVVAIYRYREIMTERKAAREKGKYSKLEPARYSDEEIAKIDKVYANEKVRGAVKRYWEDVEVGESLGKMAKGPLTVTDIVTFHAGGYGWVPYGLTSGRMWYKNRVRIPAFFVKDANGIPDTAQRLHWDSAWAQAIGNPMAYDYGVMRECYLYHYFTDWCGDDGWVFRQYDEIRKFNYQGDTQFITGEVVGKREHLGMKLVDVKARLTNQRGEDTVFCEASIALPSRETGIVALPEAPQDVRQAAAQMLARHWELTAQKRRQG